MRHSKILVQKPGHSLHGSAVREIKKDAERFSMDSTEDAGLNRLDPRHWNTTPSSPRQTGKHQLFHIHGLIIAGDEV